MPSELAFLLVADLLVIWSIHRADLRERKWEDEVLAREWDKLRSPWRASPTMMRPLLHASASVSTSPPVSGVPAFHFLT
jgi:hypothetical protein